MMMLGSKKVPTLIVSRLLADGSEAQSQQAVADDSSAAERAVGEKLIKAVKEGDSKLAFAALMDAFALYEASPKDADEGGQG